MILAWLCGKPGSLAGSPHSEGACCSTDEDSAGNKIHADCCLLPDYTLRKAFDSARYPHSDERFNNPPTTWCNKCGGLEADCIFCHTAEQLLDGPISQREEALNHLIETWPKAPDSIYEAAGVARK